MGQMQDVYSSGTFLYCAASPSSTSSTELTFIILCRSHMHQRRVSHARGDTCRAIFAKPHHISSASHSQGHAATRHNVSGYRDASN